MSTKQIHIFISHSWKYSEHYNTLEDWIFNQKWIVGQASLDFRNFSVPKNDPIHDANNDNELENAIFNQISRSHVIVIPTGIYTSYSKWIKREIGGSKQYSKPILAVSPWGQKNKSCPVLQAANTEVGWNKDPIIQNIWKLYNN